MNTALRAAAETAELGWLMGLTTVLFLGCFLAWTWYAYAPWNQKNLENASKLPFDDGGEA